ncbi:MAG: hypothetical protein WC479_06940 [Candidatus Izemoplasmatales bacterium]
MKFKDPINDEKYFQYRRTMGETKSGHIERRDAVIKNRPRMAVSPVDGRVYGTFVDEETGKLKVGLVLVDDSDWESTWDLPLIPSGQYGKIHNPFISIDPLGNVCVGYEYWIDEYHPEVWVYDERLIITTVTPFLQKVTEGSSAVTIADRENDLLLFYKRSSDGKLCWRARSQPPYESVWATENVIDTSELSGDLYIDDAFLGGGPLAYEAQWVVLCVAARHANGRFTLHYLRSSNWPRYIESDETLKLQNSVSAIDWTNVIIMTPEETLTLVNQLVVIDRTDNYTYDVEDSISVANQILSILWSGGSSYSVGDKTGYIDKFSVSNIVGGILWTLINDVTSPNEDLVCSYQITDISWTAV